MKKIIVVYAIFRLLIIAQTLPADWSQSYCTYDVPEVFEPGEYGIGFAIDNYTIYSGVADTVAYDTRRFDIYASYGLFKNVEVGVKYSYPTAGVLEAQYQFLHGKYASAIKLGFGYMKGTREGYITDYVYDVYPTLLLGLCAKKCIKLYWAPKIIYSLHMRDRQEDSDRQPVSVFQYGHGVGLKIGDRFAFMPEANWLFGVNEGVKYTVNQFGLGVMLEIQ
ncbi:MAG: hypothetical protein JSW02_02595 [candidate division WOR-3 bacterium]|nr:MAG: hypothetical protein JSW02_02595 [candidate division WOR-3 bacterium]